jgi:hypothetical protein
MITFRKKRACQLPQSRHVSVDPRLKVVKVNAVKGRLKDFLDSYGPKGFEVHYKAFIS